MKSKKLVGTCKIEICCNCASIDLYNIEFDSPEYVDCGNCSLILEIELGQTKRNSNMDSLTLQLCNNLNEVRYYDKIVDFLDHSNKIEGECGLNPGDWSAYESAVNGINTVKDILDIHRILTKHLNVGWSGKLRTCNVRVGNYVAPDYTKVSKLIKNYVKKLSGYNAYQAYCEFEKIHPFQDFNGRVGRLIWVYKKFQENWNFERSFLEQFHYDSLTNYRS